MPQSFFYARVSKEKQNEARQMSVAKKLNINPANIYLDKESGKDMNRPSYTTLIKTIDSGDTLYIHDQDRLSRDHLDFHRTLADFRNRGIILYLEGTIVDYNNPSDSIMRAIKSVGAQEERLKIVKNVSEGVRLSLENRKKRQYI